MKLHELAPVKGSRKNKKRVGRGISAGQGKTSGKGMKGQKVRTGNVRRGFEGGQMPFQRRIPKRGFTNIHAKKYAIVNVKDLENFNENEEITAELLIKCGKIKKEYDGLKILGFGEINKKLNVSAAKFSKSAKEKIEKAGGKVQVI